MSSLPVDFDWEVYCTANRDLWDHDIKSLKKAKEHWIAHGKKENRKYKLDDREKKEFDVIIKQHKNKLESLNKYFSGTLYGDLNKKKIRLKILI